MRVKLLTLRYAPALAAFDERPLTDFLADKEILAIREHFFVVHDLPHLACLVTYHDPHPSQPTSRAAVPHSPSPLEQVPEPDRALFATLREWRNARARRDGIPPYVILTNRELATVVRTKPRTESALAGIDGLGAGKVERYGRDILAKLHGSLAAAGPDSSPPLETQEPA
jgi:superfamily II DNA helicase RecQ